MGCDPNPPGKQDNGGYQDCIAGNYCPEGTDSPIVCPAGTFNAGTGVG